MFLFGPQFSSVEEARQRIKELQQKSRKLREQKGDCNASMRRIRQKYSDRMRWLRQASRNRDLDGPYDLKAERRWRDSQLQIQQQRKDGVDREIEHIQKEVLGIRNWINQNR